jgi:hypothetical protein
MITTYPTRSATVCPRHSAVCHRSAPIRRNPMAVLTSSMPGCARPAKSASDHATTRARRSQILESPRLVRSEGRWFNPSIAHQRLCSSEPVFERPIWVRARYVPKGVKSVLVERVERGVGVVSLGRLLSTVFRNFCGESCFTELGRTGPRASRARRAAHHPAGSFTTRSF